MIVDTTNNYKSPVRLVGAKVELWEGSTLADTYNQYYGIKDFSIERVGESKFFGFGICQRFNIHLIDLERYMYITTADRFKVSISTGGNYINQFPDFYVSETHRDENTNELSVTAYDVIYKANSMTVNDINIPSTAAEEETTNAYTIDEFANACALAIGANGIALPGDWDLLTAFWTKYETGANFEGTETIREALNAVAEATQTIYYVDANNYINFKRLNINGDADLDITKSDYITLESGDNRRLAAICHTTELGDNVTAKLDITGTTQYVRDNPFWELRDDVGELVEKALAAVGGLTINQFSCYWRGNPLLEIGDKIGIETKDGYFVSSFLLDDVINYDGSLSQDTRWSFEDSDESESNPSNLGDALKQTFARVDKVNKQIDLVVSKTEENSELLTNLQLTTDNITASVEKVESNVNVSLESVNNSMTELTSKVAQTITAEDLTIEVQNQLSNGVDKVITSTGFTFNEEGLTVSKTGSEMETTITEDGMTVYRDEEAVLTANNIGVNATNLHATTYLIVGLNSRFEDFGDNRTGCFWIGGNN